VRGFAFGLVVLVGVSVAVLSIRPGGLRRQLRLAARRLRIVLVLAGIWTFGSLAIRVAFPGGPVLDYGPAVLGIGLASAFLFMARDSSSIR
jgi:hypothetical protein